jgi:chemosensory pili system protein ChpC
MNQDINVIQGAEARKAGSVVGQEKKVRCLTLNFFSYKMLIPNASVAEVTDISKIEPRLGAPEWFGGMMKWREQEIPVLVFEKVMNIDASKPQKYRRVIILNTPNNKGCAPFLALGCQSIPSLTMVEESRLGLSERKSEQAVHIKLDGEEYIIPDVSLLEERVSQVMADS